MMPSEAAAGGGGGGVGAAFAGVPVRSGRLGSLGADDYWIKRPRSPLWLVCGAWGGVAAPAAAVEASSLLAGQRGLRSGFRPGRRVGVDFSCFGRRGASVTAPTTAVGCFGGL